MLPTERRYDIDWLRVIAIALLLVYHIAIAFQPWGVFIGFIQNAESLDSLWVPMSMLNVWRIPLLFAVSGMGVSFALRKRNWKQLILERTRRILLPFLFGVLAIVPLHRLLWQHYYSQDLAYAPQAGHLWFLANIFVYVVLFSPLFFYLKKHEGGKAARLLRKVFGTPAGLLVVMGAFVLETVLMKPVSYELYALTLHGFLLGALAFLSGYLFVFSGDPFRKMLSRGRWFLLTAAVALFLVRCLALDLQAPGFLKAMETCLWIFAVLALGSTYLNRPGRTLAWLSQAAYPVYILHMVFLYLGSDLIMPLGWSPWIKFLLLIAFTFAGCFVTYEFIVRRVAFLRPLFGLKPSNRVVQECLTCNRSTRYRKLPCLR